MKILLTSVYANVADRLLELIDGKPEDTTVAFIPTAADVYLLKWFVDADRDALVKRRFKIKDVLLHANTAAQLEKEIAGCSVIFVAGGNVFYLLQEVRKSGFDKILGSLRNTNVVYVGSSAGSVLVGPDIGLASELDDPRDAPELKDYRGLHLVDFVVLPHYGETKHEAKYQKIMKKAASEGLKVKTLRDDEYLIADALANVAMNRGG